MNKSDVALAGLRSTLLAACGLGVGACTTGAPTAPESTAELEPDTSAEPFSEQEPGRDPTTVAAALCPNPTALVRNGQDTGYIQCGDGAINRASVVGCLNPVTAPACRGTESDRSCDTHANCTDAPHGFCMSGEGQRGEYCGCVYPCLNDAECEAGEACMCPGLEENGQGPSVAECGTAECKVNADCPSGECGASIYFNGCGHEVSLHCREASDACRTDASCPNDYEAECGAVAVSETEVAFQCTGHSCAIGRPLTVDSGVRVAAVERQRWGAVRLEGLLAARDRADYWLGVARMEHASVASFARFVNELMGFGAPPDLLASALAAAADEVRHAEQTFAIASAYADAPIGPGALRVDDLRPTRDPELFVTRLIVEGCVGETLGVAEMLALLEQDLDPVLRPRLEQIAADETRHAALAWRSLKWFAGRVAPAVIERAFEQAIAAIGRTDDQAIEPIDPLHGRLGSAKKRRVHALAIASVIEPCRRELQREHVGHASPEHPAIFSKPRLDNLVS